MIFEENVQGTALIIGRFQPITKAHFKIIDEARKKYAQTYIVVVSSKPTPRSKKYTKSGDLRKPYLDKMKKNPFSGRYRSRLIYKALDGKVPMKNIITMSTGFVPSVVDKIYRYTSKQRAKSKVVLLAGSDRVGWYKEQLENELPTNVRVQEVDRNMDSADNISATRVREAIANDDIQTFKQLTPTGIHDEFQKMKSTIMDESITIFARKLLKEMIHIEDLKIDEFIDFVKNIYETEASIKLDGTTALGFGWDEKGFFTGFGRDFKDIKPEKRRYSIDDWLQANTIIMNPAISAHKLLEENKDKIEPLIGEDEVVLCEVLFGDKPNSILYDFNGTNHLVILNSPKIAKELKGKYEITVPNFVIEDESGVSTREYNQKWKIGETPTVNPSDYDIDIDEELEQLENFLNSTTDGIKNFEILSMRAAGKKKELVNSVRKKAKELKINIKEKLLKNFVRSVKGGDFSPSEGYSHEGIVLKKGNQRTKIIDKNVFTAIHDRDWEPVHSAKKIRKEMDAKDAIEEINKMINNFDKLYPEIDNITKERMINSLKMTKIELRGDLQ